MSTIQTTLLQSYQDVELGRPGSYSENPYSYYNQLRDEHEQREQQQNMSLPVYWWHMLVAYFQWAMMTMLSLSQVGSSALNYSRVKSS